MAKKVKFNLSLRGLNQLMRGPEVQADLQRRGERIAEAAESLSNGGEFEVETKPIRWIAVTNVRTKDDKALRAVYENNVLEKAKWAGRD